MPIHHLPKEIHYEILSHLEELIDQIAAAAASPLWSKILQTKPLQATRYRTEYPNAPGYPLIHRFLFELSNQVSCVIRNETVECYRLRFQKGIWWEDPNSQDTWDISTCPFLDEILIKPGPGSDDKPPPWELEVSTSSPLSWTYPQYFMCTGATTVRDFIDAITGGNINLPGYFEGEGLLPGLYQEILLYPASIYGDSRYSELKSSYSQHQSDAILIANVMIVKRSTKQYNEWIKTDKHLQTAGRIRKQAP